MDVTAVIRRLGAEVQFVHDDAQLPWRVVMDGGDTYGAGETLEEACGMVVGWAIDEFRMTRSGKD